MLSHSRVYSLSPHSKYMKLDCQQLFHLEISRGHNNPDVVLHVCLLFLGGKQRMLTWLCGSLFLETLMVLHVTLLYCVLGARHCW